MTRPGEAGRSTWWGSQPHLALLADIRDHHGYAMSNDHVDKVVEAFAEAVRADERKKCGRDAARKAAEFISQSYCDTAQILDDNADKPEMRSLTLGMHAAAEVLRSAAHEFIARARAARLVREPEQEAGQ